MGQSRTTMDDILRTQMCNRCGGDAFRKAFFVNGKNDRDGVLCPKCHDLPVATPQFFPKGHPVKPLIGRDGSHY